jgi:AcrR family transcriptional regulator
MKPGGQPALRERIRETTVQAILSAAEEVFADKGLHAAHMGEIAARAGVAVGTLYNHFEDREALLAGLLSERRTELLARIDGALADTAAAPFRDRLRTLLQVVLAHKHEHRRFFHILMQGEIGRYEETFPSACRMPTATMREVFSRIEKVMKQGIRDKVLRPEMGELAPVVFMGMIRAMAIREVMLGSSDESAARAEQLVTFFLEGAGT